MTGFFEGFGVSIPNVFMGSAFEGAVYNRRHGIRQAQFLFAKVVIMLEDICCLMMPN